MEILIAVIVFSLLILFHELGHFALAKAVGVGVTEFALGMGPILFSWGKGETKYAVKALPFGGSCTMVGEDEENPAPNAFNNKPAWARFLVIAAGPVFNFILALIVSLILVGAGGINPPEVYRVTKGSSAEAAGLQVGDLIRSVNGKKIGVGRDLALYELENAPLPDSLEIVFLRNGEKRTVTVNTVVTGLRVGISYYASADPAALSLVTEESPAAEAGLQAGDVITGLNGTKIASGSDMHEYLNAHPFTGEPIRVSFSRGGETKETTLTPESYVDHSFGFEAAYLYDDEVKLDPFEVIGYSFREMRYWFSYTLMSLKMIFRGQVGIRDLSGPVGIVETLGDAVETGMESGGISDAVLNVLTLMVLLNVTLGVMNLLPLPALDGGRLLFIFIELITGKRIPEKAEGIVHLIGFILLMALMVFVLFSDVLKLFGK